MNSKRGVLIGAAVFLGAVLAAPGAAPCLAEALPKTGASNNWKGACKNLPDCVECSPGYVPRFDLEKCTATCVPAYRPGRRKRDYEDASPRTPTYGESSRAAADRRAVTGLAVRAAAMQEAVGKGDFSSAAGTLDALFLGVGGPGGGRP